MLLTTFWWGSVFLVTLPIVVSVVKVVMVVPAHVNESDDPVDHLGGILSAVLVGGSSWLSTAAVPNAGTLVIGLAVLAVAAADRVRDSGAPLQAALYDLAVAGRRTFWVAACAGIIVFRRPDGAMFIGRQFLQNVLGTARSKLDSPSSGSRGDGSDRPEVGQTCRHQGCAPRCWRVRRHPGGLHHHVGAVAGRGVLLAGRARAQVPGGCGRGFAAPGLHSPPAPGSGYQGGHGVGHRRPGSGTSVGPSCSR
ncbi:MAG: hypothetical protein IPF88_14365 [Candidatus Microthrix sp.]|nr:hypothetical protein [Candidatus Microthrix sp.]MBK6439725.1 hypothetical protein [Candidatus Microthrix sp.]